ncbi:MAG: DegT/DnrJ/EryC1/StrS family aminotransferase [Deltaproteobacteria bacterium]|nr:DegT/DnrJ/EryC1/StrS family aminotransferase [Deltaproteobacteria bacterium]
MEFIDLASQQTRLKQKLDDNIQRVLAHGKYVMGPEVLELEKQLAGYVGARHAIGCASGTDALLLALLSYGVGSGDAIFTTPFTFIATAEVISLLGAAPIFVDIESSTFNLDPTKLKLAVQAVQSNDPSVYPLPYCRPGGRGALPPLRPRGVITVDLFGLPADYDRLNAISSENDLFVIEDAAQSFGAEYKGNKACALGHIGCTSFFPAKPLGCYGDGGMCFTADDSLNETIRSLRVHGQGHHKYDHVRIGINGRLDTLQAAILLAKFEIFPEEVELRQQVAQRYSELLAPCSGIHTPSIPAGYLSVWAQYSLLAESETHRTALQQKLKEAGIPTAIYYPKPLHLQTAFAALGYQKGDFPISEDYATRIFSVPMHPYLQAAQQESIAAILRRV